MTHYDELYSKGGFKYRRDQFNKYVDDVLVGKLRMSGSVLDAPCGDGYFSRLLRSRGMTVTSSDLSKEGCKKAGGIVFDLERPNLQWVNEFDWVYSRAITHLHYKDLYKSNTRLVFRHMLRYAPKVVVVYSTSQTNRDSGNHFNHTRANLDQFFRSICGGGLASFMYKTYYHAVMSNQE